MDKNTNFINKTRLYIAIVIAVICVFTFVMVSGIPTKAYEAITAYLDTQMVEGFYQRKAELAEDTSPEELERIDNLKSECFQPFVNLKIIDDYIRLAEDWCVYYRALVQYSDGSHDYVDLSADYPVSFAIHDVLAGNFEGYQLNTLTEVPDFGPLQLDDDTVSFDGETHQSEYYTYLSENGYLP